MNEARTPDMSKKTKALSPKLEPWIDARSRHRLSHAHVQVARELGLNPKRLGAIDNHDQELWKVPLPEFIEHLYLKRFDRDRPEVVTSIEQRARDAANWKAERKAQRASRQAQAAASNDAP
jgi:hypothetical protein